MASRAIIVGAIIAVVCLWLGPFSVPDWAVIAFVFVVLFPMGIVLTVERMRLESRWARTLWRAVTRR